MRRTRSRRRRSEVVVVAHRRKEEEREDLGYGKPIEVPKRQLRFR